MNEEDEVINVLPIHYSAALHPNIHIHQYPLLTRPLQTPPSAALTGKRIRARVKPNSHRLELHVPVDTRPEVWNGERSKELGGARADDDREKNQDIVKGKQEGEELRLGEVRLRSEEIPKQGAYMLGIVRDGHMHLHPITEAHQFRPTLTYLDILSRRNKRSRGGGGSDSDSDDGPPPDPDEPAPAPAPKKEKKVADVREVQVSARKAADDKAGNLQGGLSAVRRDMLLAIRAEEDETWQDLEFCDGDTAESNTAFETLFSQNEDRLECKTDISAFIKEIKGLVS
ncbi:hypothetical protein SERLA73DRAFT_105211 [Serpula lacrymans var. lacrymans S7.3]|uniref:DNA-directed RNA polymerase III subunit Rpc5 n=2 Tax=Serpula lacrymans var. lacrymans TaxID=341189 RepID=F8PSP4_SERL3|nr:uncharacterized protein SERLADRAFT_463354 [Serpula lacrymans var. lacrymans S7.9]EGO00803.1 hypothetical protein SERLA73DRAFT_105211 [Serpula lacrymans var. lacrymans S7.3]EGO26363.1 hypothetical protein SERLADRAFT_463354 [Serpula lacrymans var. lacrymans S7.9]